jgi:glutathione S-transferase
MEPITLYHSIESTCAHKVRLVLAEKKIPWQEKLVNLRKGDQFKPGYLALNPKAVVPTLVHGSAVLRESTIINEYLDDAFPQPALKPADPVKRATMRLWIKTFDDEVHPSIGITTYATVLRHQMNALKSAEEMKQHFAAIPDPGRRQRQQSVHEEGIDAEAFKQAVLRLDGIMANLDTTLANSSWLAGETYSLADAAALPYIMRLNTLQFSCFWGDRPHLAEWYQRNLQRDNATELQSRNTSASLDTLVEQHGRAALGKVQAILAANPVGENSSPNRAL